MKKIVFVWIVALCVAQFGCESSSGQKADEAEAESAVEAQDDQTQEAEEVEEVAQSDEAADDKPEGADEPAGPVDDLASGHTAHYGAEFILDDEPITLAVALEQAGEDGPIEAKREVVKVEADIVKVCKKKGCWFTLGGDGVNEPVRVRMKDYGFFVPRNADGGRAIVEGTLEERVVPQEEAQHYADDEVAGTDKEAEKVEGDQTQWEMTITAAQVTL